MIKIFIDIDGQELEVTFLKVNKAKHISWVADCYLPDEVITINEVDGFLDENSLSVSSGISTPKIIIYERILSAFNEYYEEISAGFEPTEGSMDGTEQPQPYNPDDIKVRRETFSVFEINRMMNEKDDIDLNPDFQRNLVWDNTRKSALIESILLGIPIPVFYFAESKTGKYHVVDGLQRLSTINLFFKNDFTLKKLEHLHVCNGKYYIEDPKNPKTKGKSLERKYTRRLENAQLIVNVIEYASPQKVKYDIFKRLNTGGRPLNKQEVRNCVASQQVRAFLKTSAASKEFLLATGESVSDNRMDAQELVLRFIGFRLERKGQLNYSGDMNSFLDDVLDIINDYSEDDFEEYKNELLNALRINYHLFGKFCFRKCLSEHLKNGAKKQYINKALFVSWMIETYNLNQNKIKSEIPFESFSIKLASELDKREKYYTILTTGTSDRQNLKDASQFAKDLLIKNIIL
jgi:uncharacterized protein with ParB-like and HNH nuclease domain